MEIIQVPARKSAFNFGIVLGLILTVLSMLTFILEMYENKWMTFLSYIIIISGICYGIKKRRDNELGGYISYGGALKYGTLLTFFAAIVSSLFLFIYLSYVDDSFIHFTLEKQETDFYEQGLDPEMIEVSMSWTKKFMQPLPMSVIGLFGSTLFGFIVSLIAAAVFKKNADEI